MRKLRGKKAQGLAIDKLLKWIIIVLVITSIVIFIFRADILKWMRNLPGYSVPDEQEIDYTNPEHIESTTLCEDIGSIKVEKGFFLTSWYISLGDKKTNFLWKDKDKTIELDEMIDNEVLGSINSKGRIKIDDKWFSEDMLKKHPNIESLDYLKLLNGAYKRSDNSICRLKNEE